MSEEQLSALLAKLKEDIGLREKLQAVADLDAFLAMAEEAGFNISKPDWLKHQARQTLELSDEELEGVAGGATDYDDTITIRNCKSICITNNNLYC